MFQCSDSLNSLHFPSFKKNPIKTKWLVSKNNQNYFSYFYSETVAWFDLIFYLIWLDYIIYLLQYFMTSVHFFLIVWNCNNDNPPFVISSFHIRKELYMMEFVFSLVFFVSTWQTFVYNFFIHWLGLTDSCYFLHCLTLPVW